MRSIRFLLAATFVGALSPNCLAQKGVSDNEAFRLANAKFRVIVTLGDVRQECAGPRAMAVNDRIDKGQSREEAESSIEKNFATLTANSPSEMGYVARMHANKASVPFSNFILCVTKISNLQRLKIGDDMGAFAHIKTAGSAPTGGGNYIRINQTQWSLLRDEDQKQYLEFQTRLTDGSQAAPPSTPTKGGNKPPVAAPTVVAPSAAANLSQQQIASCSEEIKRTQVESRSWTGNVNDVAARLGHFQKDLFEGRCAGHPEAQAYIAGANKMLAHGGSTAGSGGTTVGVATPPPPTASSGRPASAVSQAPVAAAPSSTGSANPARSVPGGALGVSSSGRTRTLLAPRGYEMLVPSDVIVGLGWRVDRNRNPIVGDIDTSSMRVAPGRDFEEARKNQWEVTSGGSTMQDRQVIKASELTGKVGLGWVAWVLLADWWPEGYGYPIESGAFVAGGATLDEAVGEAFRAALGPYQKKTNNGPIRTFFVQAGVSAKPDYQLYKSRGTYSNYHALPFSFDCDMPATAKDAQDYGFTPRVPETPEEFVRYVRTQQSRQYLRRPIPGVAQDSRWYGCWKVFRNNPISETSEPVFIISPF